MTIIDFQMKKLLFCILYHCVDVEMGRCIIGLWGDVEVDRCKNG